MKTFRVEKYHVSRDESVCFFSFLSKTHIEIKYIKYFALIQLGGDFVVNKLPYKLSYTEKKYFNPYRDSDKKVI